MNRNDELMDGSYEILPFRDLPHEARMAMAWYMAVDGEAWSEILDDVPDKSIPAMGRSRPRWVAFWKEQIESRLPAFDAEFGDVPFGLATLPLDKVVEAIESDPDIRDDADFDYRASIMADRKGTRHGSEKPWPVILSTTDDETLQDGWHRIGSYIRSGMPEVPALFYPQAHHLEAAGPKGP